MKVLSIEVGQAKHQVVITSGTDTAAACRFTMNDSVTKSEALLAIKEIEWRLIQESSPPTVS